MIWKLHTPYVKLKEPRQHRGRSGETLSIMLFVGKDLKKKKKWFAEVPEQATLLVVDSWVKLDELADQHTLPKWLPEKEGYLHQNSLISLQVHERQDTGEVDVLTKNASCSYSFCASFLQVRKIRY